MKTKINQQNVQINSGLIYYWSITPTCFGPTVEAIIREFEKMSTNISPKNIRLREKTASDQTNYVCTYCKLLLEQSSASWRGKGSFTARSLGESSTRM